MGWFILWDGFSGLLWFSFHEHEFPSFGVVFMSNVSGFGALCLYERYDNGWEIWEEMMLAVDAGDLR